MKVYIEKPIPKCCADNCPMARKVVDNGHWYVCFPTGRIHTSIRMNRPDDCPICIDE